MDYRLKLLGILAGAGSLVSGAVLLSEYADVGVFSKDPARAKNSISAVVTGIVANQLFDYSSIDVNVGKQFWPDTQVTGYTTPEIIKTDIDLSFSSVHFKADKKQYGLFAGTVVKSEFDWNVKQKDSSTYKINRFGPKFDAELNLQVENGQITGTYVRPGPHFNWDIKGTYDSQGNIKFEIDGPLNLGLDLSGKITQK